MSIVNIETLKQNNCELWFKGSEVVANAPKVITAAGDVKQILPFAGAGIGMFDGTDDYLSIGNIGDFDFGSGNFTIEFTIKPKSVSTLQQIITIPYSTVGTPIGIGIATNGKLYWGFSTNGSSFVNDPNYEWTTVLTTASQYNVAVVRNGSTITGYVNGISEITFNISTNSLIGANDPLYIGKYDDASRYYNGYLSELRISNVARYTANFTPPRRQLESDSNTKLLLHFQANNATFVDSSPTPKTITAYGNATQLTSPCGSGIAKFDGTGDCLTIPDHADLEMAGDFTIEFLLRINATGGVYGLVSKRDFGEHLSPIVISVLTTNKIVLHVSSNGSTYDIASNLQSTSALLTTAYYHIALVRYATSYKLYINGVSEISANSASSPYNNAYVWVIGATSQIIELPLNGSISEFRFSDIARYTANFTPSTRPFKPDSYTKLLLHMDGVGAAFYDSSDRPGDNGFPILPDGVTVTPAGTFTMQKLKNGQNCLVFDGSTNYITISDHANWAMFLSDFTICGWVKFDTIAANRMIIGQYADASNSWILQWNTDNTITLIGEMANTATFSYSCPLTPVAGTWYHVTVQRSGSTCLMYINLVSQTVTVTTAFTSVDTNVAATLNIGGLNSVYNLGNFKDIQLFRKALTLDQLGALMNGTYIY